MVVEGVSHHMLHNNAQLMAGYSVSERADQTVDGAHDTMKVLLDKFKHVTPASSSSSSLGSCNCWLAPYLVSTCMQVPSSKINSRHKPCLYTLPITATPKF